MTIDFFFLVRYSSDCFWSSYFSLYCSVAETKESIYTIKGEDFRLNTVLRSDIDQSQSTGAVHTEKLPHLDKISKYNIIFFSKMILYYLKQGGLVALDCISCSWLRLLAEVSCKKVKIKLQTIRVIVQQGQQRDQCLRTSSSLKTRCAQLVS